MRAAQLAGYGTTIAIVIGIDLPIDWLVLAAMTGGGIAVFAVTYATRFRG
jgi:hypothetical protein